MTHYRRGEAALLPVPDLGDHAATGPDEEAVLLDVAAHFAAEHGVPHADSRSAERELSLRRAARDWPLLVPAPRDDASGDEAPRNQERRHDGDAQREDGAGDEVVELLGDAVEARDRFPRLWSAASERGLVGGRELRQLVRQHRDKPLAESLQIDADQAAVLESEPALWRAVFRASRFLGRLHDQGLTDDQILGAARRARRRSGPRSGPRAADCATGRFRTPRGVRLAFRS